MLLFNTGSVELSLMAQIKAICHFKFHYVYVETIWESVNQYTTSYATNVCLIFYFHKEM